MRLSIPNNCYYIRGGGDPLNYGGYKKIDDRGFNFKGFEGAKLTKLRNFRIFLNWYFICYNIFAFFSNGTILNFFFLSHFAQIGSTVFKATFCISTFWRQKVKRGLHFWEFNPLKPPRWI